MSVEQTRITAGRWLERTQRSDWSAEDQAALDAWLSDPGNKVAYLRVKAVWQSANRLTALRRPSIQPMRAQPNRSRANISPFLLKTAAILALIAVVGPIVWQQMGREAPETYVTNIGGHKIIAFKDGTRVEMNTDTVLRVSQKTSERKVWLDKGEAYFEIEHDAARPFIVIAQGRKIIDLGTKFAVRHDIGNQQKEQLQVSVVEGLVEVEAKGEKPNALLKPGDVLTATPHAQSVAKKSMSNLRAGLGWKQGKLSLDYVTLAEAAAEFNRYNTRKLIIKDLMAAKQTIVGTFQTRDLEAFTGVVTRLFGLKAETTNNQIILSH